MSCRNSGIALLFNEEIRADQDSSGRRRSFGVLKAAAMETDLSSSPPKSTLECRG